jgi:hypothetical protein
MRERKLGDIDMKDYLRMVDRPRLWRRTRVVVTASVVILAFTAGRFGPWAGTNTSDLSMTDATALLQNPEEAGYEHKLATIALFQRAEDAVRVLGEIAARSDEVGMQAGLAIGTIAEQATKTVSALREHPKYASIHQKELKRLQQLVEPK